MMATIIIIVNEARRLLWWGQGSGCWKIHLLIWDLTAPSAEFGDSATYTTI